GPCDDGHSGLGMRRDIIEALFATGLSAGTTLACGDARDSDMQTSGIVSASASHGESGSASQGSDPSADSQPDDGTAEAADGTAATDDEGTVFDLGVQPDSDMPPAEGCEKVDFLFV